METTFDEELYTTKLVRGPQLREREREAQRIAREIVGQQTRNVHLAEVLLRPQWTFSFLLSGYSIVKNTRTFLSCSGPLSIDILLLQREEFCTLLNPHISAV